MGKAAAVILLLFLLWSEVSSLSKIQELGRLGVYELGTSIDGRSAGNILEQAASITGKESSCSQEELDKDENREKSGNGEGFMEYPHDVVFFSEKKKQTVENPLWYRQTKSTVVEILGDSTLLFPFGYPLEAGDLKGCLLGEDSARELFGGTEVIGEEIVYAGKTYVIRGILQKRDILVIEGGEDACFSYAGILGDTTLQKDERITELQNLSGIFLTEIPFRFYGTIVRAEIVVTAAFLYGLAGLLICRKFKENKAVKKGVVLGAVFCAALGIVFVLSITSYRMPDKVSELSWWGSYFREEKEGWDALFGREEIFLQEDYKQYLRPGYAGKAFGRD